MRLYRFPPRYEQVAGIGEFFIAGGQTIKKKGEGEKEKRGREEKERKKEERKGGGRAYH